MSSIIQKELDMIESNRKMTEIALDADKEAFAQKVRNGMGKEMEAYVTGRGCTIQKAKKIPFRLRVKKMFRRIGSILSEEKIDLHDE